MGTSAQTQQRQVKRLLAVVNWRFFHHEGPFLPSLCRCLWPGNEHKRGNPDGHGEIQQRCDVLGGGEHDGLQAGSVQGHGGVRQVWVGQCNGEAPKPLNNPFATQQNSLNMLFNNANSRNPLSALLSRKSIGNSAQHAWDSLFRSRRASEEGLLEVDEEQELEKFLEDYDQFKEDIGLMIGNLTCVLTKMNMLDSSLQVNLKLWTTDIWQQLDLKKTLAGEDPEWRQKMINGYNDCYQIASNWPQQSLDRNPITKVFGRHMIFFKCAMKQEKKMCGMARMHSWLTTLYGNSDDFNWSQFGLPQDKYDRAALTIMVQTEAATKEEKFVNDFFINDEL